MITLVPDYTWTGIQYNITLRKTSRRVSGRPFRVLFMLLNGKRRTNTHSMNRSYFVDLPSGSEGWFVFKVRDIGWVGSFFQGQALEGLVYFFRDRDIGWLVNFFRKRYICGVG